MIIGITSLKGGCGKSQVSINLSVYFANKGYSVVIIDSDANQTCGQFSGLRPEDKPDVTVVGMTDPKQIRRNAGKLEEQFDIVIIDGVPALSQMASTIILLSDLLLIPLIASFGYRCWHPLLSTYRFPFDSPLLATVHDPFLLGTYRLRFDSSLLVTVAGPIFFGSYGLPYDSFDCLFS